MEWLLTSQFSSKNSEILLKIEKVKLKSELCLITPHNTVYFIRYKTDSLTIKYFQKAFPLRLKG